MIKNNIHIRSTTLLLSLIMLNTGFTQTIINSKHNLSATGPGTIKATSESEICIFCHTPHNSSPRKPLWNRLDPGLTYAPYNSSTTQGNPGQPDRASLLCLSCHDGTIALGNVLSRSTDILFTGGITTLPPGTTNLTIDLSDDHPVSFLYDQNLSTNDGELVDPSTLTGPVKLDNNYMECTSCHDPHKNNFTDFLVVTNQNSDLCLYCHQKNYWDNSQHKNSIAQWNQQGTDPWFHTDYITVSANACENCHNPHNADGHARIRNYTLEEQNCLVCHNGNVATENIQTQVNKQYRHLIGSYNSVHDPTEPNVVQTRHVECEDCHNPHAANNQTAVAPNACGSLDGVKGVDMNGNPVSEVQYQYEVCYRCHSDSPDKPPSASPRIIDQNNVRLDFDLSNPSYHPIEGQGKNPNVVSLISPWTESSIMYCTDCHGSDGDLSPDGVHGSIYPQIMKYNYERLDWDNNSSFAYELCFKCHDENILIGRNGVHEQIRNTHAKKTSCNTCHDPHGTPGGNGNSTGAYLINFDLSKVSANSLGILKYVDLGPGHGECYLMCHNHNHDQSVY